MTFWIFKVSDQETYADQPGSRYIFANTHSTHVLAGDAFLYLDKRKGGYALTGHGNVRRVTSRKPLGREVRSPRVRVVYTAHLADTIEYRSPLDLRPNTDAGRRNRLLLGISDVNRIGWSASVARLEPQMYERIMTLAYEAANILVGPLDPEDFEVPDAWSMARKRHSLERFRMSVLRRQGHVCAICGTGIRELLEVAHVSPYATDSKNRANPANGIGLCAFCHKAYDRGFFRISPEGEVRLVHGTGTSDRDRVAQLHVSGLDRDAQRVMIQGVDQGLLRQRFELAGKTITRSKLKHSSRSSNS